MSRGFAAMARRSPRQFPACSDHRWQPPRSLLIIASRRQHRGLCRVGSQHTGKRDHFQPEGHKPHPCGAVAPVERYPRHRPYNAMGSALSSAGATKSLLINSGSEVSSAGRQRLQVGHKGCRGRPPRYWVPSALLSGAAAVDCWPPVPWNCHCSRPTTATPLPAAGRVGDTRGVLVVFMAYLSY